MQCGVRKKPNLVTKEQMCCEIKQLKKDNTELKLKLKESQKDNALNTLDILRIRGII